MLFTLFSFLLFAGAFCGVAYYVWVVPRRQAARALQMRLRSVRSTAGVGRDRTSADLVQREKRGSFAMLGDLFAKLAILGRLQAFIHQANLAWRAADVAGICLAIALLTYLILLLFVPIPALRIVLALLCGSAPVAYIMRRRNARMKKFEDQLPDAIDLFTRTMRAGHNIHSGLETIAEETSDPIRMEFRKVTEELALGSAIEAALHKLGDRVPVIDLKFFITGLILQRQTGANMVAVLENLATLIRERLNMAGKMKAHTASQRFSAGLLCALPFVVGIGFWFVKPDYLRLLWTDPLGIKFFTYGILSEIVGILVIRHLSRIRV
ncbi:MAG: type II secretion system F family protein [Acidobacteriota bacterium]